MSTKQIEALKLALEALEYISSHYMSLPKIGCMALAAVEEALAEQPAQQESEPDRVKFERHWRKTRGEKKANRELPRHPLQPQTYIQDSANRHWVTWQAAVKSVSQLASKPWVGLTDEQIAEIAATPCAVAGSYVHTFARAIEAAHGITGEQK